MYATRKDLEKLDLEGKWKILNTIKKQEASIESFCSNDSTEHVRIVCKEAFNKSDLTGSEYNWKSNGIVDSFQSDKVRQDGLIWKLILQIIN